MGQRHVFTFRLAQRAAYRTAISAAQTCSVYGAQLYTETRTYTHARTQTHTHERTHTLTERERERERDADIAETEIQREDK